MSVIEKAVQWALNIAADNSHGYSQNVRWGPSYDCSSLVISAFEQAGAPVKTKGATYTGNMYHAFISCGFKDVTKSCNLYNCAGMKRGDVLLNIVNHTALYLGNGQLVHARSSEGTSDTYDNSGNEIRSQGYYNYPWDCVLRYEESSSGEEEKEDEKKDEPATPIVDNSRMIEYGMVGEDVKQLQESLIKLGFDCGIYGADGEFGFYTLSAVKRFQMTYSLEVDGIVGPLTKAALKQALSELN